MKNENLNNFSQDFTVFSSKIDLFRNLKDFNFPQFLKIEDLLKVKKIILQAFLDYPEIDSYYTIDEKTKEKISALNYIKNSQSKITKAVFICNDESTSFSINFKDHLTITSVLSKYDFMKNFNNVKKLESFFEKKLNFAGNKDFGFFTPDLQNSGNAIHLSSLIHIPSLAYMKKIKNVQYTLNDFGCKIQPAFLNKKSDFDCEFFFQIDNISAIKGDEFDQVANIILACNDIIKCENEFLERLKNLKSTVLLNHVITSLALAKSSLLISLEGALRIISDVKIGIDLGIASGIEKSTLLNLVYKIRDANVKLLLKEENLEFEEDVSLVEEMKYDRIRAMILNESLKDVVIGRF